MTELKTKTLVGKIGYTNCLPFYHGLEKACDYTIGFHETFPSKINLAMRLAKIDLAPVSSLEYLNHQKKYVLLPDFVIGSRDFSGSVLLFSRSKIEKLNQAKIALSRESLSSAALLRILLKFKFKFENRFVSMDSDPDRMLAKADAALVIGDSALFHKPEEFVYKYDLSELWWNWTGKPFCFAVWAVRREFAETRAGEVSAFCRTLRRNLDANLVDIEKLLKESLGLGFMDARFSKIFGYLFNLSYGMDPSMREGLELFYRFANRLGISPRLKNLEFFNEPS